MDNFDPFSGSTFDADRIETLQGLREFAYEMRNEGLKSLMILLLDSEREEFNKRESSLNSGISIKSMSKNERFQLFIDTAENLKKTAQKLLDIVDTLPDIRQATAIRTTAALRRERKALAKAGESGARSTHSKAYGLKAWAEREAAGKSDLGTARRLAGRAPAHLVKASESNDPVRLIYNHLRNVAKLNTAS